MHGRALLRRRTLSPLPPATISEYKGIRYLHLGSLWEQGAMRIRSPDKIETTYLQQMMMWLLFAPSERWQALHVVQLGLGAAALTKFCYRCLPDARVTAIEINRAVIDMCRAQFALPPNDARLQVIEMDAFDFVRDPARQGAIDVLQVDLYDADADGPVLNTAEFYRACAACLTADGMMTVNLFGTTLNYEKSLQAIEQSFESVMWLPEVHTRTGNQSCSVVRARRVDSSATGVADQELGVRSQNLVTHAPSSRQSKLRVGSPLCR